MFRQTPLKILRKYLKIIGEIGRLLSISFSFEGDTSDDLTFARGSTESRAAGPRVPRTQLSHGGRGRARARGYLAGSDDAGAASEKLLNECRGSLPRLAGFRHAPRFALVERPNRRGGGNGGGPAAAAVAATAMEAAAESETTNTILPVGHTTRLALLTRARRNSIRSIPSRARRLKEPAG